MGIVRTETTEQNATTFEATPVSLPYFAENITVLFALGTDAEIRQAVRIAPPTPQSLNIQSIINGKTTSFNTITR